MLRYIVWLPKYKIVRVNPSLNYRSFWRDSVFHALARLLGKRAVVFFRGWDNSYEELVRSGWVRRRVYNCSYGGADRINVLGDVFAKKVTTILDN